MQADSDANPSSSAPLRSRQLSSKKNGGSQSVLPGPRNYIQRAVQVVAKEKAVYAKAMKEKDDDGGADEDAVAIF